ncbi:ATP-binding protein [Endothiovibrio diazotrophicus]
MRRFAGEAPAPAAERFACRVTTVEQGAPAVDGVLEIRVADNGCGIARERLQEIFLSGSSTKLRQTGMGLHSVANFVLSLGGAIEARSEGVGRGAEVVIRLPRSPGGGGVRKREATMDEEAASGVGQGLFCYRDIGTRCRDFPTLFQNLDGKTTALGCWGGSTLSGEGCAWGYGQPVCSFAYRFWTDPSLPYGRETSFGELRGRIRPATTQPALTREGGEDEKHDHQAALDPHHRFPGHPDGGALLRRVAGDVPQ